MADDFCKIFDETVKRHSVSDGKKHRNKPNRLSDAEVITILILFHMEGYRCLKHFYVGHVCLHCRLLFPKVVSYNRFVELEKGVAVQLEVESSIWKVIKVVGKIVPPPRRDYLKKRQICGSLKT